jgi:anti-sigma factor RsiW
LNCKGVIRKLSGYIDGDLTAAVKLELEQHLHRCQDCSLVVNQTKMTVEIFCDSEPVDLPTDVRSRLHDALRRRMRRSAD